MQAALAYRSFDLPWDQFADQDSRFRRLLIRWLCAYPVLIVRYLTGPAHRIVVIPYMGMLDMVKAIDRALNNPMWADLRDPAPWEEEAPVSQTMDSPRAKSDDLRRPLGAFGAGLLVSAIVAP